MFARILVYRLVTLIAIASLLLTSAKRASASPVYVTESQIPNYIFPNEVPARGVIGGGTSHILVNSSGVSGDLVVRNFTDVWLTLSSTNSEGATVESDDIFVGFGVLPPGASVTYRGIFTQVAQTVSVSVEYDFNAWLWNTADTILRVIPGGSELNPSVAAEAIIAIKGLNSVQKAAIELVKAQEADGWPAALVHVLAAANELRKLVTEEHQVNALLAILAQAGIHNISKNFLKNLLIVEKIYEEIKHIAHTVVFFIVTPGIASVVFEAKSYGVPPTPIPPPVSPTPVPLPKIDNTTFVFDITIPDGTVISPNQPFVKTWRLRNTGTSTWGADYQLAFIGGNQLGAPSSVNLPQNVAPGGEVNISVNMATPAAGGSYQGNWQMRNAQGVYFGDLVWVRISVPGGQDPGGGEAIEIVGIDYPSVVSPGQSFRPRVTVKVNQGQLRDGDMLRNTDDNLYGAWPHVGVVGTVNAGSSYTFEFSENDPITAPSGEGTYESKWRIWRNGNWAGPEITIRFDVRSGSGMRPDPPSLVSPGNWYVSRDGSAPNLCASAPAGLEYDFQIYESHDTPDSGWVSSSCWTPGGLGPYGYQWHVKVRDPGTGLESGWSETWHFNIDSQELTMDDFVFSPGSPSTADRVRVYTCVRGFGGIGLGLSLYANKATDGSASGEWQYIHPIGTFCYNRDDPNTWPDWETLELEDGTHLVRATGTHDNQTVVKEATYTLGHRRPNGTELLSPINDIWLNNRTVTFRWGRSTNTQGYRLWVSSTGNRDNPDIYSGSFGANDFSHTLTLSEDYPDVYWWLESTNDVGSNCCSSTHFGIDRVPPNTSVAALDATTPETSFPVSWSGSDDRSRIRWYDVQYRDGDRGEWTDWQVNVTQIASIFVGQAGHSYCFRSRAMDNAGNWEPYPGGNGDTCTRIDSTAVSTTDWWDTAYTFKRNLVILNNDGQSLATGYPIHLHFDNSSTPTSGELYNASQSSIKGDDVRIIHNNQTELSRFVHTFRNDRIDIWFNLQAGIGPSPNSDTTSYQLYFGNPNASNPPGDVNDVLPPSVDGSTAGLWNFTEGSGTILGDNSGNGHSGTASSMGWGEGKFGPAGVFNGTNSVVNLGNSNAFNASQITLEAWIYPQSARGGEQTILRKARSTSDSGLVYDFQIQEQRVYVRLNGNSGWTRSNTQLEDNRWYHVAATYDGSTIRVYVNGRLDNTASYGVPLESGSGTSLYLGGDGRNNNKFFHGEIQHARVSNVARSTFMYGTFGTIFQEPSFAAGDLIEQPQPGSPDLAVESLSTYITMNGTLIQAVVANRGDGDTGNGFWIDLYANHRPIGPDDLSGSFRYWVVDPIQAGTALTVTALISDIHTLGAAALSATTGWASSVREITETLYLQADSKGTVNDADRSNNISSGLEVCSASIDAYETDGSAAAATLISTGRMPQTHNIHIAGDEDWFKFNAVAGETYRIGTGSLGVSADTHIYLYGADGVTLLTDNDDYGGTLASQIQWQAPTDDIYYFVIKHWNPNVGGCGTSYEVFVSDLSSKWYVYLPFIDK